MPELPEVENFRKYFEETSLNKKISEVKLYAPEMLKECSIPGFIKHTRGYEFITAERHGKYFFAGISSKKYLVLHFGMTGSFNYYKLPEDSTRHIRLEFKFSSGFNIAYDNMRKFGLISLTDDPAVFIKKKKLGTDPIKSDLTYDNFKSVTNSKRGTAKSLLMDQSVFSGLGNLYSDEALFHAGVHPSSSFESLPERKKKNIYLEMMSVLKTALKSEWENGELPRNYLFNHRSEGSECPLCGGKITHRTIAGRTSYFCPSHQKRR